MNPETHAASRSQPTLPVHCQEIVNAFDQAWSEDETPRIEQHLDDVASPVRERLLRELLAVEIRRRKDRGDIPAYQDYLVRFPEHQEVVQTVFQSEQLFDTQPFDGDSPTLTAAFAGGSSEPTSASGPSTRPEAIPWRRFGSYDLLEELARGGMGIVYKARQHKPDRIVALKMILSGQLASEEAVQRFHAEAEAAAGLDHPNIVSIYEVGEREGRHFFSMTYVPGRSLATLISEGPLPPREAARLLRDVALAVDYAHRQGIIHRDLKPANILLDETGQVRVTDFGLAKKIDTDSGLTASGQVMGTPSYMPPEQAAGRTDGVGPLVDVYALGATLYCLVTGRPPFQAANVMETLKQVLEREPVPPRHLNPDVDRDLETICLKCLDKDPARRYVSAAALAEELTRFLQNEPIRARPIGRAARLWRWCRRRPGVAGLTATALASLIAGIAISTVFGLEANRRAEQAAEAEREALQLAKEKGQLANEKASLARTAETRRQDAERQKREVERRTQEALERQAGQYVRYAWEAVERGRQTDSLLWLAEAALASEQLLAQAAPETPEEVMQRYGAHAVANQYRLEAALRQYPLAHVWPGARAAIFSPDDRWVATGGNDGLLRVWDRESGALAAKWEHADPVLRVAFSPNGRRILTTCTDHKVRVFDLESRKSLEFAYPAAVTHAAFADQGQGIVAATDAGIVYRGAGAVKALEVGRVLDLSSDGSRLIAVREVHATPKEPSTNDSPDFPSATLEGRLYDVQSGDFTVLSLEDAEDIQGARFSDDGRRLAIWTVRAVPHARENLARRHPSQVEPSQVEPSQVEPSQDASANDLAISQAGPSNTLDERAADFWSEESYRTYIWDTESREPVGSPLQAPRPIVGAAFSGDATSLATHDLDGEVVVWSLPNGARRAAFQHRLPVFQVALSPDGRTLAAACGVSLAAPESFRDQEPGEVHLWDIGAQERLAPIWRHSAAAVSVSFSGEGRFVLAAGDLAGPGEARLWDTSKFAGAATELPGSNQLTIDEHSVSFSTAGNQLAAWEGDRVVTWDPGTRQQLRDERDWPHWGRDFRVEPKFELRETVQTFFTPEARQESLQLTYTQSVPNHRARRIPERLFEIAKSEFPVSRTGFSTSLPALAGSYFVVHISPRFLVTDKKNDRGLAQVWDARTGRPVTHPLRHATGEWIVSALFTADNQLLLTYANDNTLRLWEVATSQPITPPLKADRPLRPLALGPDGRYVAAIPWEKPYKVLENEGKKILDGDGPVHPTQNSARSLYLWELFPARTFQGEEWRRLAQLLSMRRIDEAGNLESLPPKESAALWAALHAE